MPTAPSLVAQLLLKGGAAPYCAHRPTLPQFSNITIQRSCQIRQIRHYTAEFAPPRWAAAIPYTGTVLQICCIVYICIICIGADRSLSTDASFHSQLASTVKCNNRYSYICMLFSFSAYLILCRYYQYILFVNVL